MNTVCPAVATKDAVFLWEPTKLTVAIPDEETIEETPVPTKFITVIPLPTEVPWFNTETWPTTLDRLDPFP